MKLNTKLGTVSLAVAGLLLAAAPAALAADLYEPPAEPAPAAAAPKPPSWTISFEAGPEFGADPDKSTYGNLVDWYSKVGVSTSIPGGFSLGFAFQDTIKIPSGGGDNTYAYNLESTLGYKIKLGDSFSITPSALLGFTWGDTNFGGSAVDDSSLYYAFAVAADLKVTSQLTWNVFNARWRDTFQGSFGDDPSYDWKTPKVSTAVSYAITPTDTVQSGVGYGWRYAATGDEQYHPDKWNFFFAYKHAL